MQKHTTPVTESQTLCYTCSTSQTQTIIPSQSCRLCGATEGQMTRLLASKRGFLNLLSSSGRFTQDHKDIVFWGSLSLHLAEKQVLPIRNFEEKKITLVIPPFASETQGAKVFSVLLTAKREKVGRPVIPLTNSYTEQLPDFIYTEIQGEFWMTPEKLQVKLGNFNTRNN